MSLPKSALSAQATIAWNADTGQVAGYKAYYGTSSGNYAANLDAGNNTSVTLQSLAPQTYYVAVTAYDSNNNQSAFSPELAIDSLTASAGSGGSVSPSGNFFLTRGASQTFTITPVSGYQVADVKVDGVSVGAVTNYTLSNITASHTISATFSTSQSTPYTITANAGSNGSISPSGSVTVGAGANQTFNFTPASGYQVSGVEVDGVGVGAVTSYTFSNVTANHAIFVSFALKAFTITSSAGPNGSISPSGLVTVSSKSSQTFAITPASGYQVSNVQVDGVSVGALTSYTFYWVTANHTISATFAPLSNYTVTATAGPNGSISPSGSVTVISKSSQTFAITPAAGCKVSDVQVDGVSVGALTSYTFYWVTADHSISASFVSVNPPPVADAGPDQTVARGAEATLDGLNSTDVGGPGIASYQWTQIGGPQVTLSNASAAQTTFYTPVGQVGALIFQLTVTDKNGLKSTAACIVNSVKSSIAGPVANAGSDQTGGGGAIVILDGSKSSAPYHDYIQSYAWQQIDGPAVTLSDPTSSTPTFVSPQPGTGTASLSFMLTVTDEYGLEATDICFVNVAPAGSAPQANAGSQQTVTAGNVVKLDGLGSTAPNGIAAYRWRQTSGAPVTLSDPTSATPTFTSYNGGSNGNNLTFRLTVKDKDGLRSRANGVVVVQ